jgi:hypothetical protein
MNLLFQAEVLKLVKLDVEGLEREARGEVKRV